MAVTKTENGMQFPAAAYAYAPDAAAPSTWKLRLWESPEKKVTAAQVGRAMAALGKGFRGQKVEIPAADRAAVMAKVRAAWKSAHPDMKPADMPAMMREAAADLREAATTEIQQICDLVCDALGDFFQQQAAVSGKYEPWGVEAMFPGRCIVYQGGRYFAYDYTIGDDNQVKLSFAGEVVEDFTPVGSSAMKEALDGVVFLEADITGGAAYEAAIVRAGLAKNSTKTYYPDAVLREAAPRFEGARMFVLPEVEHLKPNSPEKGDARNIVGWISGARFVEGAGRDAGYIAGTANLLAGELRDKIADAWQRGKRDLVALSIDALGTTRKADFREAAAGAKRVATAILKVNSVDVITNASAGGALVRLVEAADTQEQDTMKEKMLAAIKAKFPTVDVAALTEEQILARYAEAMAPAPSADMLSRAEFQEAMQLQALRASASAKINATKLPAPSKERLVARFNGLARFTEADIDSEIKAEQAHVVRMAEALGVDAGKVKLAAGDIQVEDRSVRINDMLDAFFDPKHKNHRDVQSFRECYREITGDKHVTGMIANCDRTRMAEALGAAFRESIDTAAFANVLGSTLNRRLVAEYGNITQFDGYRYVTGAPVPLADFRTNERVRFGGFGDLPIVAENGAYLDPDTPTDEKASYAAQKRGRTVAVSLEAIKNDDVGFIRRIPVRVGRSAKRTEAKFVWDFVLNNAATSYDGVNWFHANHGNLGAAALDAAGLSARRLAMLKQTEKNSLDRLNLNPAALVVPVDLQETAWNLFQRSTNFDKTFQNAMNLTIVPVWYWTDTNDWALFADPNDSQVFELGFLDGQQEPQLFVQDMPNVGSMFSNDQLTYKIRHIYGGIVTDHRGADKSVVA